MRTKWKRLTLWAIALVFALSLCFGFAFAEEKTYTTDLHAGFGGQMRLGTWKQTQADAPEQIDELVGETVAAGETHAGKAYLDADLNGLVHAEKFMLSFDAVIANGQVGFNFRAARSNDYNPYQGFGGVLIRLDAGQCFVLNNGAVVDGFPMSYGEKAAAGDTVTVTVEVEGTSMNLRIKKQETVVAEKTGLTICSRTENADKNGATSIRAGFYLEGDGISSTFSNISATDGEADTENVYRAYPFPAKPMTETLAYGFGRQMRLGTWKQTEESDPTRVAELQGAVVAPTGENAGKAYLDADFEGIANRENFTLSFDAVIANGQVGFNFRAAKSNDYNPYQGYGGVLIRLDAGQCFVLNNGAVVGAATSYGGNAAIGDTVTVTVEVEGTSMNLLIKKQETVVAEKTGLTICSHTENADKNDATEIRAGFYLEGEGVTSSFSRVSVSDGGHTYKAFPFEVTPFDPFPSGNATAKLNPNFSVMCGKLQEGTGGAFVQGTALHVQKETAAAISTFGGVYGENFSLSFDVTAPSQIESDANEDAGAGFFFRAPDPTDSFSGISVRIQKTMAVFNMPNGSGGYNMTGFVFVTPPAAESLVHVQLAVQGQAATLSFRDANNAPMPFRLNGVGSEITEYTVTGLLAFEENADDAQYAGVFVSKSAGKIKNLVMTRTDGKRFEAWPFAAGKEDLSDDYIIRTDGQNDKVVPVDPADPDFEKADYDIVQEGYPYIIYVDYNGAAHDLRILKTNGDPVESDYVVTIHYKKPPYTTMTPWTPQTEVNRHGIFVTVADADGYVYANINCALKIRATALTIEDVVAVDRPYDGTRVVELSGGRLVGVPAGLDIGFELGEGQLVSAGVGNDKEVETYIRLTGADAKNFTLVQPALTVNVTKGVQAAPETPEVTVSGSTITVKSTDEDDYLEFKLDDGAWQSSRVFENVASGTHTVYSRYVEDANYQASESASVQATVSGGGTNPASGGCGKKDAGAATLVLGLAALAMLAVGKIR